MEDYIFVLTKLFGNGLKEEQDHSLTLFPTFDIREYPKAEREVFYYLFPIVAKRCRGNLNEIMPRERLNEIIKNDPEIEFGERSGTASIYLINDSHRLAKLIIASNDTELFPPASKKCIISVKYKDIKKLICEHVNNGIFALSELSNGEIDEMNPSNSYFDYVCLIPCEGINISDVEKYLRLLLEIKFNTELIEIYDINVACARK